MNKIKDAAKNKFAEIVDKRKHLDFEGYCTGFDGYGLFDQMLKGIPNVAVINRNALIDFAKYGITVEQAKAIMNDGWVKEVK